MKQLAAHSFTETHVLVSATGAMTAYDTTIQTVCLLLLSYQLCCYWDRDLDDVEDRCQRLELALRGVFAGNVFDLGAQGTADMFENGEVALPHSASTSISLCNAYIDMWVVYVGDTCGWHMWVVCG